MVGRFVNVTINNIGALIIGAMLVPLAIVTYPALSTIGESVYDRVQPVITDWTVLKSSVENGDLVIEGTMVKARDCLFVPPTLARDVATGRNYVVVSTAPTAGRTWGASDMPQAWGPWRVAGGAGKTLTFVNIYACGRATPVAAELGTHVGTHWGRP